MSQQAHGQDSPIGGAIGSRIVGRVVDGVVAARSRTGGIQANVAQKVLADFTNHVSDEVRAVTKGLWVPLAEHPDVPDELRALFRNLGTQRGQAWAWIAGTATGAALGGGLLNLLTNTLNPVVLPIIASSPHGILGPQEAAAASVRGLSWPRGPEFDANAGGVDTARFNALREMAKALPTVDELRLMMLRGRITLDEFAATLRAYGYADKWHSDLIALSFVEASPAELAAMWNRGIIDRSEAVTQGRRVGASETLMDRLIALGGEPPGVQELLLAWRRGVITESDVDRALRQGPLRFEWIDVIKQLQWEPMSLSEAADAINQGHITRDRGLQAAREHGVRPEDFDVYVDNAGLPPGPQETLDWVNRGLLSEAEGERALYESRIKNKWVPTYMRSRHETMPPETVRLAYKRGVIDRPDAVRRLKMRGYSPEDAEIIADMAVTDQDEEVRQLTVAQVRNLYADRLITRQQAESMLLDLGWDQQNISYLLAMSDVDRVQKFTNAVLARLRAGYVGWRLSEQDVLAAMDAMLIPPDGRDDMIALWNLERDVTTKGLTTSQIQQALRRGLITEDEGYARLRGQGYDDADARLLVALTMPAEG